MNTNSPKYMNKMHPASSHQSPRSAFTILEIILSIAILGFVLSAVGQILNVGTQASVRSRHLSEAAIRADTVMAEILAGVHPKQATADVPFEDAPDRWFWSLDVIEGPHIDLLNLQLVVSHRRSDTTSDMTFTLNRWVRTDEVFLESDANTDSLSTVIFE